MIPGTQQSTATDPLATSQVSATRDYRLALPEDLSFASVMSRSLTIPTAEKGAWLDLVRDADKTRAVEILLDVCHLAPSDSVIRWAGGCKGFDAAQVEKLFKFVAKGSISQDGLRCFQGAAGSGGTMDFAKDGTESIMICQVPYYMARLFNCVAWGSTPQTYRLRLDQAGSPIVSQYGAHFDPRGHLNVLTSTAIDQFQGWDGDVRWYVEALASFAKRGMPVAIGVVNGGDVTLDEALLGLSKDVPVIVVEGTGRAADQIIAAYKNGSLNDLYTKSFRERSTLSVERDQVPANYDNLHIVQLDDPSSLCKVMDKLGLLTS